MKLIIAILLINTFLKKTQCFNKKNSFSSFSACFEQLYNYTASDNLPVVQTVVQNRKSKKIEFFVAEDACKNFSTIINTIKMDTDCGNTEIAKDVIQILMDRRDKFCEFFEVLKEEFTYYCIQSSLKPAQDCKSNILQEFENHYITRKGDILEYMRHQRGDIDFLLGHLSSWKLKNICCTLYKIRRCAENVVKIKCELAKDQMLKKARNEVTESLKLPFEEFRCTELEKCDLNAASRFAVRMFYFFTFLLLSLQNCNCH